MSIFTPKTTKVTVASEGMRLNRLGLVCKDREGTGRDILCLNEFMLLHMSKRADIRIIEVETQDHCSEFCPASPANVFL